MHDNKIMLSKFFVVLCSDLMLCINSQMYTRCHSSRNISAIGRPLPTTVQGIKFIAHTCSHMLCIVQCSA